MAITHRPTALSLFSGVGALDLAVHRAFGARFLGHIEWEASAASVLLERMETKDMEPAPVWCGDYRELPLGPFVGRTDILVAGFPCQPFSTASRGRKVAVDEWPGTLRSILRVKPRNVVLENVSEEAIRTAALDLSAYGYRSYYDRSCASEVGAAMRRERWWLLAYADDTEQSALALDDRKVARIRQVKQADEWAEGPGRVLGMDVRTANRVDRLRMIGNSVCPIQAEETLRYIHTEATK